MQTGPRIGIGDDALNEPSAWYTYAQRAPRPGSEEDRTPRHDLSETESEEEDNPCQADAIAWKEGAQIKRLSKERCKDAACTWVKLLNDDGIQSSGGELRWDGLQPAASFARGTKRDVTPKRGTQNEAAELPGISSPPRLNGATSDAVHLLPEATVEDQVLSGLTWEEIAGIPEEEMRKRAVSLTEGLF
ncbi:tRNA 2'-phosphotransferase 1 [Durusdinium trenchii]|uniref:tRNA 2'-phosphotransferase 1 n=1 Tax=Durusdinium trenchii TaxID=1381693 RepID=A0ABP0RR93_9DINO